MPYAYTNTVGVTYYLHRGAVKLAGSNVERPAYYFRKQPDQHAIDALPDGYEIYEGPRSALPVLRKKGVRSASSDDNDAAERI